MARFRRFSLFPGHGPGQPKEAVVSNDPWRTVSIGSDEVVVTLAFRDPDDLRQAMKNALAANSWDYCNSILAAALSGEHKSHELSGDCWCQPRVEKVDV